MADRGEIGAAVDNRESEGSTRLSGLTDGARKGYRGGVMEEEAVAAMSLPVASRGEAGGTAPRVPGRPWPKGVSGNPAGRSKKGATLTAALQQVVKPRILAQKVWALVMQGDTVMIRYVYDRIDGMPVQRHEAKLQHEVDQTSRILAERYGISIEEVRAKAKALSAGA